MRLFVHGDFVVTWNEYTFTFVYMSLFFTIVQHHLSGVHIIYGKLTGTMYATACVIIEKAVKHIIIVEYQLQRILFIVLNLRWL